MAERIGRTGPARLQEAETSTFVITLRSVRVICVAWYAAVLAIWSLPDQHEVQQQGSHDHEGYPDGPVYLLVLLCLLPLLTL